MVRWLVATTRIVPSSGSTLAAWTSATSRRASGIAPSASPCSRRRAGSSDSHHQPASTCDNAAKGRKMKSEECRMCSWYVCVCVSGVESRSGYGRCLTWPGRDQNSRKVCWSKICYIYNEGGWVGQIWHIMTEKFNMCFFEKGGIRLLGNIFSPVYFIFFFVHPLTRSTQSLHWWMCVGTCWIHFWCGLSKLVEYLKATCVDLKLLARHTYPPVVPLLKILQ